MLIFAASTAPLPSLQDVAIFTAAAAIAAFLWANYRRIQLARDVQKLRDTVRAADKRTAEAEREMRSASAAGRLATSLLPGGQQLPLPGFLATLVPHPAKDFATLIGTDGRVLLTRGTAPETLPEFTVPSSDIAQKVDNIWSVTFGSVRLIASDFAGVTGLSQVARCGRDLGAAVTELASEYRSQEADACELKLTRGMLKLRSICEPSSEPAPTVLSGYLTNLSELLPYTRASLFLASGDGRKARIVGAGNLLHAGVEQTTETHEEHLARLCRDDVLTLGTEELSREGIKTLVSAAAVVPVREGGQLRAVLTLMGGKPAKLGDTEHKLLEWVGDHLGSQLAALRDRVNVHRQATVDALTGLSNRAELNRRLPKEVDAATAERPCSVVLLDLDHFKTVNDVHGHAAGDAALTHVADILRWAASTMRVDDKPLLARYGGEELLMLLPGSPLAAALRIAELVRAEVERREFLFDGRVIPLALSGGVGVAPTQAERVGDLLAIADAGLYEAKRKGRNRIECVAEPVAV